MIVAICDHNALVIARIFGRLALMHFSAYRGQIPWLARTPSWQILCLLGVRTNVPHVHYDKLASCLLKSGLTFRFVTLAGGLFLEVKFKSGSWASQQSNVGNSKKEHVRFKNEE